MTVTLGFIVVGLLLVGMALVGSVLRRLPVSASMLYIVVGLALGAIFALTGSLLAMSTFAFWVSVLTWLSWRSQRARHIIEGVPLVLVVDGEPVDAALELEQMPLAEVLEAARQAGLADLEEVRLAVLEPSGRISIIKRD